jgi:hypothetical protein
MFAAILSVLRSKNYKIYTRPYELNIVGIRADSIQANRFDDEIHVFFKNGVGKWIHYIFSATTDPGTYWLRQPMHPQGTAILRQGQYRDTYQIGLHKGKYYALVQRKPVTVIRDYDRNAILDFNNGRPDTGMFGINIHRAAVNGITKTVDIHSAGCQVFSDINGFNLLMQLSERHRELYGNTFTYTLIDKRATSREQKKILLLGLAGVGTGIGLAVMTYKLLNDEEVH